MNITHPITFIHAVLAKDVSHVGEFGVVFLSSGSKELMGISSYNESKLQIDSITITYSIYFYVTSQQQINPQLQILI